MKKKVYIETSVISYLTAWKARDIVIVANQQITRQWWKMHRYEFDLYVSQFVVLEASRGDPIAAAERLKELDSVPTLQISEDVRTLTRQLIENHALPKKAEIDAFHVAVSACHQIDFLLTWNCKHIANAQLQAKMKSVCAKNGFGFPHICTPQELLGV